MDLIDENDSRNWSQEKLHPIELGGLFDFRKKDWPVSIAIDIIRSWGDDDFMGMDLKGSTLELNIGIRKIWEQSRIHPIVGGGLAVINAELDASGYGSSVSEDDTGIGIWLECGIKYLITEQFSLGLNLRYSKAEITLFDVNGEAGGAHAGVMIGYHWQ